MQSKSKTLNNAKAKRIFLLPAFYLTLCALLLMVGSLAAWLLGVWFMAVCLLHVGFMVLGVALLAVWLFGCLLLAVCCLAVGSLLVYGSCDRFGFQYVRTCADRLNVMLTILPAVGCWLLAYCCPYVRISAV